MSLNTKLQVSDSELRPFVEKILREQGEDAQGLTVDDVLNSKMCRGLKSLATLSWQNEQKKLEAERRAEEAREQAELNKQKAEKVAKIEAKLREQLGLKTLSIEELDGQQILKSAKSESQTENREQGSWIPADVTKLAEKFGEILPGFVFKNHRQAVTFRGWLGKWNNECKNALDRSDLSPEYRQALIGRGEKIRELMSATTQVVVAWGLDPKTTRTEKEEFYEMCRHLEVDGGRFDWLTRRPAVKTSEAETPVEGSFQQEAEIVAGVDRESQQKRWDELVDSLKARLLETVDAGLPCAEDKLKKMAVRLAKKYGDLSDIKAIFAEAAANKMMAADKTEIDEQTAKHYARAAGLKNEEFEAVVNEHRQRQEANAKAEADKKAEKLKDPRYGAIKPSTVIAKAKNKNDKKKADGQKKGKGKK